jgi:hypothetical protein
MVVATKLKNQGLQREFCTYMVVNVFLFRNTTILLFLFFIYSNPVAIYSNIYVKCGEM